jgi:hypothetical protein
MTQHAATMNTSFDKERRRIGYETVTSGHKEGYIPFVSGDKVINV